MTSVKYHGEYPEGRDYIEQYGVRFEQGKAAKVEDKAALEKLATNRFFEVSGESDKDEVKQGQEEAETNEAETLRAYLDSKSVPYRANASVENLRKAKADYDKSVEAARED